MYGVLSRACLITTRKPVGPWQGSSRHLELPRAGPCWRCAYRRTPQPIRGINPSQSPVRAESGRRSGTAVMPPIESLVLEQVLVLDLELKEHARVQHLHRPHSAQSLCKDETHSLNLNHRYTLPSRGSRWQQTVRIRGRPLRRRPQLPHPHPIPQHPHQKRALSHSSKHKLPTATPPTPNANPSPPASSRRTMTSSPPIPR